MDVSTVNPRVSHEVADRVRKSGAVMLGAPVSGSVPQVQTGTPTIMVGGDEETYRRVEPVLRELGAPTRVGGIGQGLVLKLAVNVSLGRADARLLRGLQEPSVELLARWRNARPLTTTDCAGLVTVRPGG